jgi:hypothetical protein
MTQLSMLYSGVHVGRLYIAAELHKLLQAADSRLHSQCTALGCNLCGLLPCTLTVEA